MRIGRPRREFAGRGAHGGAEHAAASAETRSGAIRGHCVFLRLTRVHRRRDGRSTWFRASRLAYMGRRSLLRHGRLCFLQASNVPEIVSTSCVTHQPTPERLKLSRQPYLDEATVRSLTRLLAAIWPGRTAKQSVLPQANKRARQRTISLSLAILSADVSPRCLRNQSVSPFPSSTSTAP